MHYTKDAGKLTTPQTYSRKKLALVRVLAERDGWRCHYCQIVLIPVDGIEPHLVPDGAFQDIFGQQIELWRLPSTVKIATIDHAVPTSKGGGDDMANLVLACRCCNSGKCNTFTKEQYAERKQAQVAK